MLKIRALSNGGNRVPGGLRLAIAAEREIDGGEESGVTVSVVSFEGSEIFFSFPGELASDLECQVLRRRR